MHRRVQEIDGIKLKTAIDIKSRVQVQASKSTMNDALDSKRYSQIGHEKSCATAMTGIHRFRVHHGQTLESEFNRALIGDSGPGS